MWLAVFMVTLLLGVTSDRVLGAPTPSTASRLDDDESRSFWKGWLLVDDPALAADSGRKKGQITPKSVFIAPVIKDWPDCAPGYRADVLGRCHRLVKIDQTAQLSFLLQKLNAMYSNNDKLIKKQPTSTEGPLQVAIPFASFTFPTTTPPETVTTTTETAPTEEVEMVVVAAQVELNDDNHHSTAIPGAIVTLWHLNSTTTPPPETSTIQLETTTLEPSTIPDDEMSTLTTQTEDRTETTSSEDDTTHITQSSDEQDTTAVTTDETTVMTTTETPPKTTTSVSLLSVQSSESDVKIIDSSSSSEVGDLSGAADKTALTLELPSEVQGGSWDTGIQPGGESFRWPHEGDDERPQSQHSNPWSWGLWHSTTPRTPLYHNFWSSMPQVPDPTIKTRQVIRRPPSRYPATFNGRPAPLYYQELSGQEVANMFNHQHAWHQQRHHG